jgi:hypothetical protein
MVSSSWPTKEAARPKKVLAPVEMTIPSASGFVGGGSDRFEVVIIAEIGG